MPFAPGIILTTRSGSVFGEPLGIEHTLEDAVLPRVDDLGEPFDPAAATAARALRRPERVLERVDSRETSFDDPDSGPLLNSQTGMPDRVAAYRSR